MNPADFLRRPNPSRRQEMPTVEEQAQFVDLVVNTVLQGPDREYAKTLFLASWSTQKARALTMHPLCGVALAAPPGDRVEWAKALAVGAMREILPIKLWYLGFIAEAQLCGEVRTLKEAEITARKIEEKLSAQATWASQAVLGPSAKVCAFKSAMAARSVASHVGDLPLGISVATAIRAYKEHT